MSDSVGNQATVPGSSLDGFDGVVTEAGRQMDPPPGRLSNTDLSNTDGIDGLGDDLEMVDDNKIEPTTNPPGVVARASILAAAVSALVSDSRKRHRSEYPPPPPSRSQPRLSRSQLRNLIRLPHNRHSRLRHRRWRRRHSRPRASPATASGTAGPPAERSGHEVPPGPYQAASTGTSFYHPPRIMHFYNSLFSSNLVGTALAASRSIPPVATADVLQNDLTTVRELDSLATSVNASGMFSGHSSSLLSVEELGQTRREERQIAARPELRVPHEAVRVGRHYVPVFVRPPRRVLLAGDPDPTFFSSAYFLARRRRRSLDDTESLDVSVATGDVGDASSPFIANWHRRFGDAPLADDTGSLSGYDASLSSNADSLSNSDAVSDVGFLPSEAGSELDDAASLPSEVARLPGEAGPLPVEAAPLPVQAVPLPVQAVPLVVQSVSLLGEAGSELDDAGYLPGDADSLSDIGSHSAYSDSVFSGSGGRSSDTGSHPDFGHAVPANAVAPIGAAAGGNVNFIPFVWEFRDTI